MFVLHRVAVVLINVYVQPYQQATGTLTADGSIDWLTGEALMPLGWILLTMPLGILAFRTVRNSYR